MSKMLSLLMVSILIVIASLYIYGAFFTEKINIYNAEFTVIPNGGGLYMVIENGFNERVCIVDIDILEVNEEKYMFHQTIKIDNIVKMVMVDNICIDPKSTFRLERGGHHIMFMNADLKDFNEITVKIVFSNGVEVTVKASRVI